MVECVCGGIVIRDCVRGIIDDALCRTRFPEGFRIPWQKGSPVRETSSAVLSGTGPSDCFTWPVTTGGVVQWVGYASWRTCIAACAGVRVA